MSCGRPNYDTINSTDGAGDRISIGKNMGFELIEIDTEWLAIAMFAGFFAILMTGYPVSFSFAGTAIVFGIIGYLMDAFDPRRLLLLPNN
jgi:hypothetical protein